jgi:hypothetical protein
MFTFLLDSRRDGDTAGGPQGSIWCSFCRCYWLFTKLPLFSRLKGAVAGWISALIDPNGCTKEKKERRFQQLRSKLHELDSIGAGKLREEMFALKLGIPAGRWRCFFSLLGPV